GRAAASATTRAPNCSTACSAGAVSAAPMATSARCPDRAWASRSTGNGCATRTPTRRTGATRYGGTPIPALPNGREPMEQSPRLVVDSKCSHGEGVLWCAQRQAVLWVDIHGRRLWLHRPGDGLSRHWDLPDRPGSIVLGQGNSVLLVLASALY